MLRTLKNVVFAGLLLGSIGLSVYNIYLQQEYKESVTETESRVSLLELRMNDYKDSTDYTETKKEVDNMKLDIAKLKKNAGLK